MFTALFIVIRKYSTYVRTYSRFFCTYIHVFLDLTGYYVRKYMFDYYAQKEYLAGLTLKNEQVLQELSEYREKMKEGEQSSLEEKEQLAFQEEAKKKHYMLSTETARGPYYPGNKTYIRKYISFTYAYVCTYVCTMELVK